MPYNDKQKEYTMKYLEKLKEVRFRVKPEEFEKYKEAADKKEMSMRAYIMEALEEKISK